ncbi:MAG: GGDEF domain-containing protein [Lachnospiraceae bacterium]|nr:GGDEF domain-containing protein [Lachnospiraceae bacterium]
MNNDRYHNFKLFKLIQLSLLILFGIMFFSYLKFDPLLRNNIYSNKNLLTICVFLWAFMLYSAVCLISDFTQIQKEIIEMHKLKQIAYLDSLTGIPNRNGCDVVINKYMDKRDVSKVACALIELPKIDEINVANGRLFGDRYIHDFAKMVEPLGNRYGFVGRNSGNEFLFIADNFTAEKMQEFTDSLNSEIGRYNEQHGEPAMEIRIGYILNEQEGLKSFLSVISTLYSRER